MKLVLKIIGLVCWLLGTFQVKLPPSPQSWKLDLTPLGLLLFFGADLLP